MAVAAWQVFTTLYPELVRNREPAPLLFSEESVALQPRLHQSKTQEGNQDTNEMGAESVFQERLEVKSFPFSLPTKAGRFHLPDLHQTGCGKPPGPANPH